MQDTADDRFSEATLAGDLVDVTLMPLSELISSDDPQLADSIRVLSESIDRTQQAIAGWGNYIG